MKNKILATILFIGTFTSLSYNQIQTDYALGRANKTNNKLAFIFSEPVNDYEVIFTFKNGIANINCKSPQQLIDESITNANVEAAQQGRIYDAIVLGTAERDMAIIWKDKSKDNSICRVKRTEGKYVFVDCEPISNHSIVDKYNVSGEGKQRLSGRCQGHQEKIDKLIKKANKEKHDFDAVMYGSSTNDLVIKFN